MTIMIPAWIDGDLVAVEKLDAHRRGLRHKAISVFVMRGGDVLVQRRALGKYHTPGLWANTCCTHPHWDESAETCAARRLGEELGLTGLPLVHRGLIEYRADVGDGLIEHEVVDLFTAEAPEGIEPRRDPVEVMETAWMPLAALKRDVTDRPALYTPWMHIYMADHADAIFV